MENTRHTTPLTDLDETVEHLLPRPRISSCFYIFLLAAAILLSIQSVLLLLKAG